MFFNFADFDTEHTRFASKYSLHLYREVGFDEDPKVCIFSLELHYTSLMKTGQRRPGAVHSR